MTTRWLEIGDGVLVRRYAFFDQDIVVVRGGDRSLVVDTRSTPAQARELLADAAELGIRRFDVVVNSHGHFDHAFGNHSFRPTVIWGHDRCATMIRLAGEERRQSLAAEMPELAADLAEVVLDPPDHTFGDRADIDLGGRVVELRYLGRGHTDNDIVIRVPDADVLCAGDLLENGAPPYFGDGFPLEWPATVEALLAMTGPATVVVPGHGDHAGRSFVEASLEDLREVVARASLVHHGFLPLEAAVAGGPYPAEAMREPLDRALAQLRGELDRVGDPPGRG
jgi:glyoxylase-like metal-dependent hydrolase (beta-lactamase superfamily II)